MGNNNKKSETEITEIKEDKGEKPDDTDDNNNKKSETEITEIKEDKGEKPDDTDDNNNKKSETEITEIKEDKEPETVCTQIEAVSDPYKKCGLTDGTCRNCGACRWRCGTGPG